VVDTYYQMRNHISILFIKHISKSVTIIPIIDYFKLYWNNQISRQAAGLFIKFLYRLVDLISFPSSHPASVVYFHCLILTCNLIPVHEQP